MLPHPGFEIPDAFLLVGTVIPVGDPIHVDVRAAIPADGAVGRAAAWHLTPAAWAHVSHILASRHPGLHVVGWYHSHPGMGCFFSSVDRATHRNFLPNPWNLGVVGDPVATRAPYDRGPRRPVPVGATPFLWFLGADAVPIDAPVIGVGASHRPGARGVTPWKPARRVRGVAGPRTHRSRTSPIRSRHSFAPATRPPPYFTPARNATVRARIVSASPPDDKR